MANRLPDGTVLPSFLGLRSAGLTGNPGNQTNVSLRVGEVKDIIFPSDPRSSTQQFIEYMVDVQHKDGANPGVTKTYNGCLLSNLFGGVADILRFTLRKDKNTNQDNNGLGVGSKVTMLCINGDTHQCIILGGVRDGGNDPAVDQESDGHNLFFEFNGLQAAINKDGELTVTFNGATQVDGALADGVSADAQGSTLVFSKDGSLTQTSPDGKQFIKIDHTNHKIEITADAEFDLTSSGNVVIKSTGVLNGGATDAWVLGTTYRRAESSMNLQLAALAAALSGLVTTMGASLSAAAPQLSVPIVGGALAAPMIAAAGVAATTAGPLFSQFASAIQVFEQMAPSYLSTKNLTD
jgi:hypothetical protein